MSKFTQGEWVYDEFSAIVKTVSNNSRPICIVIEEGENDYSEEDDANGRLIAAAPELHRMLKEELIPTSDYGGLLSFSREAKVRELLDRIDGEEASHD